MKQMQQPSGHRLRKNGRKHVLIGCAVIVCLLAGYMILCAGASMSDGKTFPRTKVAGVNVGGMTYEQIKQTLSQAEAQEEGQGVFFSVEGNGERITVRVPASVIKFNAEESANRALNVKKQANFTQKGYLYLRSLLMGQNIAAVYQESDALEFLLVSEIDEKIGQQVQESTYQVTEINLEIKKGTPGDQVDKQALKDRLLTMLSEGNTVTADALRPQFTVQLELVEPKELNFQEIYDEVHVDMQNASLDESTNQILPEVTGVSFDITLAQETFDSLEWGETGQVPLTLTPPEVTKEKLEGSLYRDLLGACTTKISGSSNRLSNVKLAASLCNGTVILPGQEFSYNGTVGRRTKAKGFKEAPAYIGGSTVNEVGGGVCQVSSSVYLASLRSNMKIVERYNHGYTVKYVPDGMDATVYYGAKDFRFQNNTEYPIKLVANVSKRTLNVSFYGTKTDHLTVKMEAVEKSRSGYKTIYKIDNSVPVGKTKVSVSPYSGCTVQVYRCIYQNGSQISRILENVSVYKSRNQVILVNAQDAPKYGLPAPEQPVIKPEKPPEQPDSPADFNKPVQPADSVEPKLPAPEEEPVLPEDSDSPEEPDSSEESGSSEEPESSEESGSSEDSAKVEEPVTSEDETKPEELGTPEKEALPEVPLNEEPKEQEEQEDASTNETEI